MIKIARSFFDFQTAWTTTIDCFFKSDLNLYFESLFGQMIFKEEKDKSKHFFISVHKKIGEYVFQEKIFCSDYCPSAYEPVGYIYPKSLEHLVGRSFRWDPSESKGQRLSTFGYCIYELTREDKEFFKEIKELEYYGESDDKTKHHRYSSMYSNLETTNSKIQYATKLLRRALPKSDFLQHMDYFQTNWLFYPSGTSIAPHNDVDVKSFANIVISDAPPGSKTTVIGNLDWYDATMSKLYFGGYDNKDIQDRSLLKKQIHCFEPDADHAIVFNFFNPKFYHEVPPTSAASHNALIFGTYRSIMQESRIEW